LSQAVMLAWGRSGLVLRSEATKLAEIDICQMDLLKTVTCMTCVTTVVGPIVNYHFMNPLGRWPRDRCPIS
jgi:hypothetical protein